ncbi:M56 family metallopeptidase [Lysinibacillus sp. MHQ-1]|nr:M56 family metallopeptidase [Lysinibacillus sp. MHQ-1]
MQIIVWIGSLIWITGIVILLLFSILSYLKILVKVRTATLVKDNIYETDQIDTPFVCGFLKPKIYIPIGMSDHELSYILLHEKIHIMRRDYLIKPFAFMLLIIHWFNPLMWLSYALMSKDMEMSCDESVVNKMGHQIKGSYSTSLLTLSVSKKGGGTNR